MKGSWIWGHVGNSFQVPGIAYAVLKNIFALRRPTKVGQIYIEQSNLAYPGKTNISPVITPSTRIEDTDRTLLEICECFYLLGKNTASPLPKGTYSAVLHKKPSCRCYT